MSVPLRSVKRLPLAVATVVALVVTTGASPARTRVAAPGDLVATPSFVNLGSLPAGTEGEVDVTLSNTTSQDILVTDVNFHTVNSFGLATIDVNVPAGGTAVVQVFMGPSTTGPAVMRVRWRGGSESSNWVTITAIGT